MLEITAEWVGLSPDVVAQEYADFAEDIDDLRSLFERIIREAAMPMIVRHFEEGGVDGMKFAPLTEGTQKQRLRYGYDPSRPLIRSKMWMRNASSRMIWAVNKREMKIVPSRLRKATPDKHFGGGVVHEVGTGTIPARPVLIWDNQFYMDYVRIVDDWLGEKIGA